MNNTIKKRKQVSIINNNLEIIETEEKLDTDIKKRRINETKKTITNNNRT